MATNQGVGRSNRSGRAMHLLVVVVNTASGVLLIRGFVGVVDGGLGFRYDSPSSLVGKLAGRKRLK